MENDSTENKRTLSPVAAQLREILDKEEAKSPSRFCIRNILAELLDSYKLNKQSLYCSPLQRANELVVGNTFFELSKPLEALHRRFMAEGITSMKSAIEVGTDSYIYALPPESAEIEPRLEKQHPMYDRVATALLTTVRPFVLTTQSNKYLIVLTSKRDSQGLHIRQFWDRFPESETGYTRLGELRNRKDLTISDLLTHATVAVENYADDYPGVNFPHRLSLETIMAASMCPGSPKASAAFESGSGTDTGFVFSADPLKENETRALDLDWVDRAHVDNLAQRLKSALHILGATPEDKGPKFANSNPMQSNGLSGASWNSMMRNGRR